jgi:hypothetical protein
MDRVAFKKALLPGIERLFSKEYDALGTNYVNGLASSMNQTLDETAARILQDFWIGQEVSELNLNDEEATAMKKLLTKAGRL